MRRRLKLIEIALFGAGLFGSLAYAAPGDLDTTFGGHAFTTAIGSSNDLCWAIARQADGKYVLAGRSFIGADYDFAVVRYDTNMNLDASFGTNANGKVTTPIGGSNDYGRGVAIQADGMIVVVGETWNGADWDFGLARYTTTGTLDTAFGTNGTGIMTTDISSNDFVGGVAIQTDGKIVVVGDSRTTNKYDFALARYDTNGALDTTFGPSANGKVTTGVDAYNNYGLAIALQTDGKIVVAGYGGNSGGGTYEDFALARYTTTGTLDTAFSGDGKLIQNISGTRDWGRAVAIQTDGKIVVAGSDYNNNEFIIARFTTAGALDTSFSGNGWDQTGDIGNNSAYCYGVAIQDDQKIVTVGASAGPDNLDFAMFRHTTNGVLDSSFGYGGKVMTPVGAGADYAYGVVVQPDGKIVAAGSANNGANDDFALARYHSDGRLDFKDGKANSDVHASTDQIRGLAIQADGKIVGVGAGSDGSYNDFVVARYTT
ncbi:MAG: hypothetical protein HYV35_01575, partial [Lentisphaerae bacterium]|nr:hypothetical protein [Lentisphaerota bacterium]